MKKKLKSLVLGSVLVCTSLFIFSTSASASENSTLEDLLNKLNESVNVNVENNGDGNFVISGNPNKFEQKLINEINEYNFSGPQNEEYQTLADDKFTMDDLDNRTNSSASGTVRLKMTMVPQGLHWKDYVGYSGISWLGTTTPSLLGIKTTLSHNASDVVFYIPFGFSFGSTEKVATYKHANELNTKSFGANYKVDGTFVKNNGWGTSVRVTQSAVMEARVNGQSYVVQPTVGLG